MKTFADRLEHALKVRGVSQNKLELAAKLSKGHVNRLVHGKGRRTAPETLLAISEVLRIRNEWLSTGSGPMDPEGYTEPSPSPPPADSDVRTKSVASHWFPDEVEATFAEALQHPDAPRLAGPSAAAQLTASKVTYRDRATNLTPDVAVEFCVQLLWAAKHLDEAGALGAADDEATKGALLSEVYRRAAGRTPPARPGAGASAEVLTSRAHADMEALGIVPSPAALERRRKADEAKAKKGRG